MKFFTRELWLSAQQPGKMKGYDARWQKSFDQYRAQLELLRGRLSKVAFDFFSAADIHDGELLDLCVTDGSRPAPFRGPVRAWRMRRDNPVRVQLKLLDSYDRSIWTLSYKGLRRVLVDFPTDQPLFYSEGEGFGDWGYHELTDAGTGFLRHEVLFASGAKLLFEFSEVDAHCAARPVKS